MTKTIVVLVALLESLVWAQPHEGSTPGSPDLSANRLARTDQTYVYKTVGDCSIHADVIRPSDKQPRPVILWLHGGALIWGSRTRIHQEQLARYVREGFVVVAIDYRLAPETKLPAIIEDVKDAYEWIRKAGPDLFRADPDRIIVPICQDKSCTPEDSDFFPDETLLPPEHFRIQ